MDIGTQRVSVELHHGDVIDLSTRAEVVEAFTRALQGRVFCHGEVLEAFFVGLKAEEECASWEAAEGKTPSVMFETDDATGVISVTKHNMDGVPQAALNWMNAILAEAWAKSYNR